MLKRVAISLLQGQHETLNPIINSYALRRKFTLPKLELRKFGGEIIVGGIFDET